MDWTSIVLGVLTFISGFGWLIDRKKHRQEIEALRADNRQKDMNLSKDYVTEWRTYIRIRGTGTSIHTLDTIYSLENRYLCVA